MFLILDACTISNLINVFHDTSILSLVRKTFGEVYITQEVFDEVYKNLTKLKFLYNENWDELNETYKECKLHEIISGLDKDKKECNSFFIKYCLGKQLTFKENGEYFSTLLCFYLSRMGEIDFCENINNILFVTDDAKAETLYQDFYSRNQIGIIIDSIDIIIILYLKNVITKFKAISYIEGLFNIYRVNFISVKLEIERIRKKETDVRFQSLITKLIEIISSPNLEEANIIFQDENLQKLFNRHKKLKHKVKSLKDGNNTVQLNYIRERFFELKNDLIWKP